MKKEIRINKYLAQCNLGSRRKVEEFITNGVIYVNGKICKDLSCKIDPENDEVKYKNKIISNEEEKFYLMLNKPKGYLVTAKDDFSRKTVFELLPDFGVRLFSIGRLDYQTEGLLLLTNDGDFANKIIHPKYKLPKVYKVTIKGKISEENIIKLQKGVKIEGKMTQPAKVFIKKENQGSTVLRMTIFEGMKRQIRYMIKAVGSEVLDLKRLQIGNVRLTKLPVGMWRQLKPSEIISLRNFKPKHTVLSDRFKKEEK